MIDTVKDVAAFLGALATIGGFVFSIFKFIYKPISKLLKKFDDLSGKVETLGNHDHDNYLSLLRLCLVSEEMPMSERLEAGRKYVEAGGNGAAKALYKVLLEKYENDLKNHRKDDINENHKRRGKRHFVPHTQNLFGGIPCRAHRVGRQLFRHKRH